VRADPRETPPEFLFGLQSGGKLVQRQVGLSQRSGRSSRDVIFEAAQLRPDLKVILTSAYSQEISMAALSSPAICGFIRKPFQFADLMRTLKSVLPS